MGGCSATAKSRYDNVDILKGVAILLVIWSHTDNYSTELWSNGTFGNITFFFLSGFFFKVNAPFKEFCEKRLWRLLMPFLMFYLLSIPFRYVIDVWDSHSFSNFEWNRIWEIFRIEARGDYLSLNAPLWFLLTIFWIHLFGFFVMRLPKWCVLLVGCCCLLFKGVSSMWATPVMINQACYWFGYFAIGYVVGRPLLGMLLRRDWRWIILAISGLIVGLLWNFSQFYVEGKYFGIYAAMYYLWLDVALLALSSFVWVGQMSGWLRFWGVSSLFVLGAHFFVLVPFERLAFKLARVHDPYIGLICAGVTAIVLVPLIIVARRYCPLLIGEWKPRRK